MYKGGTGFRTGLAGALIVIMVAPAMSQVQPVAARATGAVASVAEVGEVEHVDLLVGRSAIIRTDRPIKRIALPKPEIADALVTSPNEVLVHGKTPGTISLLVWGDTGRIKTFDIAVSRDLSALEERIEQLFPGEPITVSSNGADVVLSGIVSSSYVVDKATSLALGYVEKKENVVNLLRQDQGLASNQVLLRVRFAEVSRSAVQELGASYFTGGAGYKDWIARGTTQQFPAPEFDADRGGLVFSDFLNILAFNTKEQLGVVVKALQSKGLFQSLAEPNLVTQNGKEASFLAGGEYPYPVVQGGGANASVTIQFKEFGVRLKFTPTITGDDTVHLKVAPEVSALDFGNAVTVEGFRVPALSTRRTETEVELRDGQTFAIAGLIDNTVTQTMSKVPGIGDIPILGLLFKSRAYQKQATELVVMITPQILKKDSVGVTGDLPRNVQPFLPYERKTLPPPAPAFSTPAARSVAPVGEAAQEADAAEAGAESAEAPKAAPSKADRKAMEKARAEEAARARATVDSQAERAARERRQAEEARKDAEQRAKKQAEEDRKQAEIERKQAEKQAALDKKAAERQAEIDRKRLLEEAKVQERIRQEEEKLARERAKRDAEEALRVRKLEQLRLEAEKKKAEEKREEQERLDRERAKREPWPRLRSRL
jgi:pilus assembly protein CpaC